MTKVKARTYTYEGNRYYTNTTYTWYDDDSVTINIVKGDDDWDCYNGTDSDETTETTFDELPENVRQELLTDFAKRTSENQQVA